MLSSGALPEVRLAVDLTVRSAVLDAFLVSAERRFESEPFLGSTRRSVGTGSGGEGSGPVGAGVGGGLSSSA